ncbi:MAG: AraC family transcriptional regulator [Clostridia bacterium]|nr:AraC family transcriptional regulator [Clostridia bacterium]
MTNRNTPIQTIIFPDENFKLVLGRTSDAVDKAYHEEVEIKYYTEGSSSLLINGNVILAKEGDITFVNPYEIHSNISLGEDKKGGYRSLIIGLDFFAPFNGQHLNLRKLFISDGVKVNNHVQGNRRLQSVFLRIIEELQEKKAHYRLVVRGLVEELFILLLRSELQEEKGEVKTEETKQIAIIMPALSKIYTDYNSVITIEELAALCNVSKYHFCRIFKQAMGKTAVQYLVQYRIDLAEMLLKTTDKSIMEIAWQCGFFDESYFYRCYKKLKGVSPSLTRK